MTLGDALHVPSFWWMASSFAIIWGCAVAVQIHLIPYLLDEGFSPGLRRDRGRRDRLAEAARVACCSPRSTERFGQRTVGIAIFITHAAGIAVLAMAEGGWGVWLFVVLFSAGNGSLTLMRASLVAEAFGLRAYGSISGSMAFVSQAAMAAGPLIVSLLVAAWGGYVPVFWLLAVVVAVSSFGITRVSPQEQSATSPR